MVVREGNYTCPYTATGPDMFEALVRLRRQLEPDGMMVAVQGSRRDTFPSGMARDMTGGLQVYAMRPGRNARMKDLVGTLDDAPPDQLATVDEQRALRSMVRLDQGSGDKRHDLGTLPYQGAAPAVLEALYGRRPAVGSGATLLTSPRLPSRLPPSATAQDQVVAWRRMSSTARRPRFIMRT